MVLHDQRIVVRATDLYALVQERLQSRNVAGVPFFLKLQILGVHVGVRVHAVEIHPLHGDRSALGTSIDELLAAGMPAGRIVDEILVPGITQVGEKY